MSLIFRPKKHDLHHLVTVTLQLHPLPDNLLRLFILVVFALQHNSAKFAMATDLKGSSRVDEVSTEFIEGVQDLESTFLQAFSPKSFLFGY
jgi:hypothetical protein